MVVVKSATRAPQLVPVHSHTRAVGVRVPSKTPVTGGAALTIGGKKKKWGVPPECAPSLTAKRGGGIDPADGAVPSLLQLLTRITGKSNNATRMLTATIPMERFLRKT